jgi:hypothetical protein
VATIPSPNDTPAGADSFADEALALLVAVRAQIAEVEGVAVLSLALLRAYEKGCRSTLDMIRSTA